MKLYGIKNCSTVKKAMDFLRSSGLDFDFYDLKNLDEDTLAAWLRQKSFASLINTAGLSARRLGLSRERMAALSEAELTVMILENPSLLKRPIIERGGMIYVGREYESVV